MSKNRKNKFPIRTKSPADSARAQTRDIIDADHISSQPDRMIFYDKLHFIPIDRKDEQWAAEVLYFNKKSSKPFARGDDMARRRALDRGIVDELRYRKMIDPDGKAEMFNQDWKGNPINQHLNSIVEAKVKKIPNSIVVKAVDELSKSNQQKENERILGRNHIRNLINELNKELNLPPLKQNEDPYNWIKRISVGNPGEDKKYSKDIPMDLVESIKSQILDDEDMALFNAYLWKDGPEIACELGINYYMNVLNKFKEIGEKILQEIRLKNRFVFRFYTSQTTGAPVLESLPIEAVHTSDFSKPDLSDIIFWFKEYEITFGDFIRQFGANCSPEVLRDIFEKNRSRNGISSYESCSSIQRSTAKIRVGYMEFESQDVEVYTEFNQDGVERFRPASWHYQPSKKGIELLDAKRVEKHYNVWRSFYYIPEIATEFANASTNFADQAKYIFDLKKLQDQQREGDDWRYAKSSLIGYKSDKMSFQDIQEAYMPYVDLLFIQAKNEFVQAHPHGVMWFEEFLTAAIAVMSETDKKQPDLKKSMIKNIRQTGSAIGRAMSAEGKIINDGKPFVDIKTGHIESAIGRLEASMILYNMMTRALGISETAEGLAPKPRTSFGGINASLEGTENATFTIGEYFSKAVEQCGERLLYYIIQIVNEKDSSRLKELQDVVGKANGMALESIKDIPLHKLALFISPEVTKEQKELINQLTIQMATAGVLDWDIALFLTEVDNPKYTFAMLRLRIKQKKREEQQAIEAERQFILQKGESDKQFEMMKIQSVGKIEYETKEMQKKWDAQLIKIENMMKQAGQMEIKDKIKDNRIEENVVDKKLEEGAAA